MLRTTVRNARDEGFTLVELLIVIVVLGILAGIVVFGVSTFRTDAQAAACKADLKQAQTASDAYYAAKNSYASAIGTGAFTGTPTGTTLVGNGYLKAAPLTTLTYVAATGAVTATC